MRSIFSAITTEISNRLANQVMQPLKSDFDTVIPAITGKGNEVLRFMGDAALAFFPGYSAAWAAAAAYQAATEILQKWRQRKSQG